MQKVSIIIPTMDRKVSLLETLDSISKMDYPKDKVEIILIDNGSSDGTVQRLKKAKLPKLQVIENKTNIGFAPALNQGIMASDATSKYVFITNDDVIFDKKCLSELVKLAESDNKIGIIGGRMYFRNTRTMAFSGFRVNLWLGYHPYDFEGVDTVREMDVTTGGCMLIQKSIFKKIGLYDEEFFFCGEDYDLCFRAKYAGFKVMYCPTAVVWHEFLNSGKKKNNFNQLFAHYRGKFRFMFIHASLPQLFFFLPMQLFVGPFFSYFQSRQFTLPPMLSALTWNLTNLKETLKSRKKVNKLKSNSLRSLHSGL